MTTRNDEQHESAGPLAGSEPTLRQRAENQARAMGAEDLDALSPEEARRLLHELRVHQVELETQNEELRRAQEALEASRARYFDLYDLAPVGYLTVGEEGLILEANLTAATLLGVARGALLKQPLSRFILPEDQDIYYRHRKQLFETGEPQVCELRMVRVDGSPFWARMEAAVAQDAGRGAPVCRVTMSDITKRRRAEEALRESEEKLRLLFEILPVGLSVLDAERKITIMNPALGHILDISHAGLLRGDYTRRTYLRPDGTPMPAQEFASVRAVKEQRAVHHVETGVVKKDGRVVWTDVSAVHVDFSDWKVAIVTTDITERKQAEEERERLLARVREQARRVQAILDTVPDGVLLLDAVRRVQLANPAAQEALALLAEAGQDQPLSRLGDRPLAELLTPPPAGLRHEVRAGGRTFEVLAHPIQDDSESERWVLAVEDVTQEREVRARLEQQERLAAVGQLAAGIAHDFNNLMAVIALSSQMLQKNPDLPDKDRRYLDMIRDRVGRATKLVGQILDFGRRSYLDRSPLDLLPLVQDLLASLERTLPENIRLELTSDRDEYIVHGDPARLQQALMNLAANARDAMPGGGRLRFALSSLAVGPDAPPPLPDMVAGDWVCLSISDTGAGIAPEHLPYLFEPFFTTKEPGQGTGLGLSQVYGIVEQHEGTIAAHSRPGAGTTFSIYLPLLTIPVLKAEQVPVVEAAPGGTETILLVEDEPALRPVIVETLQELGYRVLAAASGAEAMAILEQNHTIDLLLTDLVLPGLNGLDLYQALHQQQPAVRGLIMTGYAPVGAGYEVFQQGEVDWIQKPFDMDDLANKIRAVLAETAPPASRARWRWDNR
jgi:two-component system cell cycle sensor histidine kinase/response regulator CckA